jgi:hypothetical protein
MNNSTSKFKLIFKQINFTKSNSFGITNAHPNTHTLVIKHVSNPKVTLAIKSLIFQPHQQSMYYVYHYEPTCLILLNPTQPGQGRL